MADENKPGAGLGDQPTGIRTSPMSGGPVSGPWARGSDPGLPDSSAPTPGRAHAWVGPAVSLVVLFGFFAMLYGLMTRDADSFGKMGEIKDVLFTLLGVLGAAFTQVVNYWLGSSKGSTDKTNFLVSQRTNSNS